MGKIGFRIRSKVNKQVSIYVYLYGPFKTRLEAKTGFVVLRDEWDIKKMRASVILPIIQTKGLSALVNIWG